MLRRLEELDRLDAFARSPEEVLWPTGVSSRHDPRAWAPVPGGTDRPRERWFERRRGWAAVTAMAILVTVLFGSSRILQFLPARAERPVGAQIPSRSDEASSERLLPIVVPPTGVPATSYAWMQTQPDGSDPVRFDPCRPLHYVTRSGTAGTAATAMVHEAVDAVSAASGMTFIHDGETAEAPSEGRAPFQPDRYGDRWAPILIAWTDTTESPELTADGAVGLGGGIPWRDTTGRVSYVSGTVWLDTAFALPRLGDQEGRTAVRGVVIHELMHVLGATHPVDTTQLMSVGGEGTTDLGVGDRYALAVLGAGDCVPGL